MVQEMEKEWVEWVELVAWVALVELVAWVELVELVAYLEKMMVLMLC
jgi:hypothetical protein